MADELISSSTHQGGDIGNLLGDDIGGLDHFSSSPSPFQSDQPLQPQPSAPQPMSAATKPLVDDDFGFDSHISTTTPAAGPGSSPPAAPNSSSPPSFTPGELHTTSNKSPMMNMKDDHSPMKDHGDGDDCKENNHHQHRQGEGNSYHHDDDDDDDGYDDREEDVEEVNYQKNGGGSSSPGYQDNPAFSDSDSPSEFHHHHQKPDESSSPTREPSPPYAAPPPVHPAAGGHGHIDDDEICDSDEHDKYDDDDDDVVLATNNKNNPSNPNEKEYERPHHLDHHHHQTNDNDDDDDDDADSLTEDNVHVDSHDDDDDDDDQFNAYPASSPAATATNTNKTTYSSTTPSEIIEAPFKSFETKSLSPQSSSPPPFSSSAAPMGLEAEEASFGLAPPGDRSPSAPKSPTSPKGYAPPSPSAPPAAPTAPAASSPSPSDHDATPVHVIGTHSNSAADHDDDDAASGFADADSGGRVSPHAVSSASASKSVDDNDDEDDDDDSEVEDPDLQMPPSAPPFSSRSSPPSSSPLAPSAPPQPQGEAEDLFHPQIKASSLYNSHSTRVESSEPEFTDQPNEAKPTLEGPWLKNIDPKVLDLIYWRDIKKTGVVFGSMLFILLSLAIFSVLSVVAYLSLAILAVTLSFRVYKNIMQAVQKSGDGHPFKDYLDWDIELNDAKTNKVVKLVMKHFNCTARELRRLFLVEDLVDSIKFGLLLWVLTYIGSWFNGMTLIINSVVIIFTLPKVYETYKVQIDNYLAMARSHFNKILQQVQAKLPFLKKKAKAQ